MIHFTSLTFRLCIAICLASAFSIIFCDNIYAWRQSAKWIITIWILISAYICIGQHIILKRKFRIKTARTITPMVVYHAAKEIKKIHPGFYAISYWNLINFVAVFAGAIVYLVMSGGITF